MRVLVTGASGLLGGRLALLLSRSHEVVGSHHRAAVYPGLPAVAMDLLSAASVAGALAEMRPDAVVHAAALADPDLCEREPARAAALNVEATRNLASACRRAGVRLVGLSTDLVFGEGRPPWDEAAPTRPLLAYGLSKREGELALLAEHPAGELSAWRSCMDGGMVPAPPPASPSPGGCARIVRCASTPISTGRPWTRSPLPTPWSGSSPPREAGCITWEGGSGSADTSSACGRPAFSASTPRASRPPASPTTWARRRGLPTCPSTRPGPCATWAGPPAPSTWGSSRGGRPVRPDRPGGQWPVTPDSKVSSADASRLASLLLACVPPWVRGTPRASRSGRLGALLFNVLSIRALQATRRGRGP